MNTFEEFIAKIDSPKYRDRTREVLDWIIKEYPQLEQKIGWNQPMFTDHGTFIIGFSVSKKHLAVTPEQKGMIQFSNDISLAGYEQSKMLFRINWESQVDYELLHKMIDFNIMDKSNCKTFWRK
ncbi:MAG: iron chaperone [Tenericutes bacterium HGW-Tenericutes-3]|nr:MAG: iron chaperone [Tenericutes bacterium HGW-Tenericutes-3]